MTDTSLPRLTFGIIVLNGEPFTRYNLRSLYPFAHEIIVAEGAVPGAAVIATPDGHSTDGTLDVLRDFKTREDPENKLIIVTAEDEGHPNGFWPGEKHEQSQAYARRATGDYLWQVDIDEFYKAEDIVSVLNMLTSDPAITQVNIPQLSFWGGFDYVADGFFLRRFHRSLGGGIPRVFKWAEGCSYVTHRPPTVHDADGRDLREVKWVNGDQMSRRGIFLYHYSLTFPKQVLEKCAYYNEADWVKAQEFNYWARTAYMKLDRPFRVHNVYEYPSWLDRFRGEHPEGIVQLRHDIRDGRVAVDLRQTDDVERLLRSRSYILGRAALKRSYPIHIWLNHSRKGALRQAARAKRMIWRAFARTTHSSS